MLDSFKEYLKTFISGVFLSYDTMLSDSLDVLSGTTTVTDIWDDILDLAGVLNPFCYCVIALALLIEIGQIAMKADMIKWEYLLKVLLKMVIAKVAIDKSGTLLEAIYLTASEWMTDVAAKDIGGSIGLGLAAKTKVENLVDGLSGWGPVLGLFISLLVVVLAIKLCGVIVMAMAYGRLFEIYILLAVSPVAFAFLPLADGGSGFNSVTMKYVKSFAAACLQGVMMIVSIKVYGVIMDSMLQAQINSVGTGTEGVTSICYTMLLGSIILVMSVLKSGSLAKQILNAM